MKRLALLFSKQDSVKKLCDAIYDMENDGPS